MKRLDLGANANGGKKWEDMVQGLDDVRRLDDPCEFFFFLTFTFLSPLTMEKFYSVSIYICFLYIGYICLL